MTIAPLFQLLFQDTPPLQQHSGAASKGISATNVSPIPFQLNAGSQLSENADLPAKIMGLLRDKNVELSSSEEIVLRNIVSTKVAVCIRTQVESSRRNHTGAFTKLGVCKIWSQM